MTSEQMLYDFIIEKANQYLKGEDEISPLKKQLRKIPFPKHIGEEKNQ